jgi:hypothetical protein
MANYEAQNYIVTNGLVLNLDAGDPDSYTRSQPPYVEVLVVAGGGSGGTSNPSNGGGAGGGAGGVIYNSAYQLTNASAITVTVGAGGAGQTSDTTQGNDGSNSVFGSLTAVGGGGGGAASGGNTTGRNGGSGGGAGYVGYYNNFNSGTGTVGQGFRGGYVLANNNAGGGGGAGGVGGDTFDSRPEPGYPGGNGGTGGTGVTYSISGTSTLYSNGGNGGANANNTIVNGSGTTGTYGNSDDSSTGGSGIVIVRYPGLPAATGGTITYLNGYTIHTFTTSGIFTPYKWYNTYGNSIYSGSLNNGVGFNSYQNGGFLTFDGTDDDVTIPHDSGLNLYPITLAAWVNITSGGDIINKYYAGTVNGYRFNVIPSGVSVYYFKDGSNFTINYDSVSGTISANIWYYITITVNSSGAIIYINASSVGTRAWTGTPGAPTTTQELTIGEYPPSSFFGGKIATSQIYNRALSAAEITQNYNAQKSRFGL